MQLTLRTVFLFVALFLVTTMPVGAAHSPRNPMTVVTFHGDLGSNAKLLASRISRVLENASDGDVAVLTNPSARGIRRSGSDVDNVNTFLVDYLRQTSQDGPANLFNSIDVHREIYRTADVIVLVIGGSLDGDDGNRELISVLPQLILWLEDQRKRLAVIILEGKKEPGAVQEATLSDLRVHEMLAHRFNRRFMAFVPPPPVMGGTVSAPELVDEALCWAFPINLRRAMRCEAIAANISVSVKFDPRLGLSTKRVREFSRRFTSTILTGGKPRTLSLHSDTISRSTEGVEEEKKLTTDFEFRVIASETGATYQRPKLWIRVGDDDLDTVRKQKTTSRILSGHEALIDWIEVEVIGEIERQIHRLGRQRVRSFELNMIDGNGVPVPNGIMVVPESHFGGPGWERSDPVRSDNGGARVNLPVDALYHRFLFVNDEKNGEERIVAQLLASDFIDGRQKEVKLSGVLFREVEFGFPDGVEGNVDLIVFRRKGGGQGSENLFFEGSGTRSIQVPLMGSSYFYLAIPDDPVYEARLAAVPALGSEITVTFEEDPLTDRSKWRQAIRESFSEGRLTANGLRYFEQSAHFISALVHETSKVFKESGSIQTTRAMWQAIAENANTGGEFKLMKIKRGLRVAKFVRPGDTPNKTWHRFKLWLDIIREPGAKRFKPVEQALLRAWLKAAVIERNERRGLITPMFARYLLRGN